MKSLRLWLLLSTALVAALFAFGGFGRRHEASSEQTLRTDPPRSEPAPVVTAESIAPSPAPTPAAPARAEPGSAASLQQLPRWDVPLDQAVPRLRELADAGNVDAQLELTNRLHVCTAFAQRQAEQADERDRKSTAGDEDDRRLTESSRAIRVKNAQRRIDMNGAARTACEKLPADLKASWLDSLERAAQSGNAAAMRSYAILAIEQYDSVNAIVADVDNAIAGRDKARAYLLEALRRGDAESLAELADAYSEQTSGKPQLFAADPAQSYVYAYAGSLTRGLPPIRYNNFEWILSESAKSLDAHQLADAQARGRRIYEQCCSQR